ncbi:DUF2795 domain-containing protein [Actinomycetospora sp. CA-084318]|uniref:DUF2795 domain-containing protein n=1 Tax=Actinomycetospora sp. CA-084318 TaxID=3239892 RepID=UPI003D9872CE
MGYDVTQVQKSLGGFDYPGGPDELAEHAKSKGADDQLVETLRGLEKEQFDGPNAVMKKLSEAGVLGGGS